MKNNSYKIDFEIYLVFIIVIGISVFNAIYSSSNISRSENATSRIMTVDIPSLQAMENMNLLVTRSKMYTTNWVYLESNRDDKRQLSLLQNNEYPDLKRSLTKLMASWQDQAEVDSMKSVFVQFEKLMIYERKIMNSLVSIDDYQDSVKHQNAEETVEYEILPKSTGIMAQLNRMILKKKMNAELIHNEMRASSRTLVWGVLGIAILIVIVILIAAFYMSNYIIVPTMKLRNYVVEMGKGEIPEINITQRENAVGQITEAVRTLSLALKETAKFAHDIGEGNLSGDFHPLSQKDELGNALIQMRESLRRADEDNRQRNWVSSRTEKINEVLRENTDDINRLSDAIIATMVKCMNASYGALYLVEETTSTEKNNILLHGSYALEARIKAKSVIQYGDGLIGQVIKDGEVIYLKDLPYMDSLLSSGLGNLPATHLLIIPLKHHDKIYGAVELAGFTSFHSFEINFIRSIGETIGSTISSVIANTITKRLLEETRLQAGKLLSQEEELRQTNEELSNQSQLLQVSEEELKQGNVEMKNKARELQQKNDILEQAREALSIKAKELELNNRYKSEFLANMSHELRTPLNSVLILAKLLAENKDKNLTGKQAEYARVIHKSGNDLLVLINDILDLSKIEAGKIELLPEETDLSEIKNDVHSLFAELANEKQIDFVIECFADLPEKFITDRIRLEQIIKNLLSNAFKFTPAKGKVTLRIRRPGSEIVFSNPFLQKAKNIIEFSVTDTGIGIPSDKQALIFEAFQQADGSTSRRYGGTGLGLSISKMLVSMLGGEMQLVSEQAKGSTFFVFLPLDFSIGPIDEDSDKAPSAVIRANRKTIKISDDRNSIREGDKFIFIVENDNNFANVLLEIAHEKKYKAILSNTPEDCLLLARKFKPSAIIIDAELAEGNNHIAFTKLKSDSCLGSVPIHLFSSADQKKLHLDLGATAYLRKPLDKKDIDDAFSSIDKSLQNEMSNVLVIEDARLHQEIIRNLLISHYKNTQIFIVSNVEDAVRTINEKKFDCIILDLDLGNGPEEGSLLLQKIKSEPTTKSIPVIVFTGTDIDKLTGEALRGLSEAIVAKDGDALEKLINETAFFLSSIHNDEEEIIPARPVYMDEMLAGKKVLLADDDMRNIYAITSVLESHKMTVIPATNGKEALEKLLKYPDVDIILMDIMMPEMDGFVTMQHVRQMEKFQALPILAMTAKAMTGDREKCLQCGASDYISKPVNMEKLFSMMRIWLFKDENL